MGRPHFLGRHWTVSRVDFADMMIGYGGVIRKGSQPGNRLGVIAGSSPKSGSI